MLFRLSFDRLVTHFLTLAPSPGVIMVRGKKRPYKRSCLSLLSLGGKDGIVIICSLKFYWVLQRSDYLESFLLSVRQSYKILSVYCSSGCVFENLFLFTVLIRIGDCHDFASLVFCISFGLIGIETYWQNQKLASQQDVSSIFGSSFQ